MQADWGLSSMGEPEPPFCWGARAIWSPGRAIDVLWDRQGWDGHTTADERKALVQWWTQDGIVTMERLLLHCGIDAASAERVSFASKGFRATASPRESHGYLYIVVEPDPQHGDDSLVVIEPPLTDFVAEDLQAGSGGVTRLQIESLLLEYEHRGNDRGVGTCLQALDGDARAKAQCARAIARRNRKAN